MDNLSGAPASPAGHTEMQLDEQESALIDSAGSFLRTGLEAGAGALVLATAAHWEQLQQRWSQQGFDHVAAQERGVLVVLEAAELLARIMRDGVPQRDIFMEVIGAAVTQLAQRCPRVVAFGELVGLARAQGQYPAAVQLEELWNELSVTRAVTLFCAYPMQTPGRDLDRGSFEAIRRERMIPAEQAAEPSTAGQLWGVAEMQEKARELEREVARRKSVERLIVQREKELADFLEHAVEGLHKMGPHGIILWANAAELELLGYQAEEYVGHHMREFIADEQGARLLPSLLRGEVARAEPLTLRCKDGSQRHVLISSNALREEGRVVYVRCFMRDVTDERRVERALEEEQRLASEVRFRLAAIVESSDDAIVSKTLDGTIQSWNAGAQRLFGYTSEEAVGKPITLIIPPELHDEERHILRRLAKGERIDHFETIRVTRGGERLAISLTVSPVRNARGVIVGASKIARNITERRLMEEALREETRVLHVLNNVGAGLAGARLDLERIVQVMTDAATEVSGAAYGAFFYRMQDEQGVRHVLYGLSGATREAFAHFPLPRGTTLLAPAFNGERTVRCEDVTKDARYGQNAPYHGMPPAHLPVRSFLAVPVLSGSGELHGALLCGHPQPGMLSQRSERLVMSVAAQAAIAIDNARLYEAAQREIANRKRAEAALSEADRRKDEFLALLAHELRNPLAPIRYAVAMGKKTGRTPEQQRRAEEIIERQAEHMSRLLDDLLDVSRITHGTLELKKGRTELTSVVAAAIEAARPLLDARQHTLSLDLPKETVRLDADSVRIAQILSNLLINAAKYTDAGGRIELHARQEGRTVAISVKDNGIGISAEMMPKLFTLFSQARPALERSEGGLGIGLALVRGLVDLHGGTIEARSKGLNRGSEFTVHLPVVVAAPEQSAGEADAEPSPSEPLRVLVADDNRDSAETCGMLLELAGHKVRIAHTGQAALDLAHRFHPHVLLLDIGMPELNGYQVAEAIRAAPWGRNMVLIAVTGWGQEADKRRALAAGFDHHLTKPIDVTRLEALLQGSSSLGRAARAAAERRSS